MGFVGLGHVLRRVQVCRARCNGFQNTRQVDDEPGASDASPVWPTSCSEAPLIPSAFLRLLLADQPFVSPLVFRPPVSTPRGVFSNWPVRLLNAPSRPGPVYIPFMRRCYRSRGEITNTSLAAETWIYTEPLFSPPRFPKSFLAASPILGISEH